MAGYRPADLRTVLGRLRAARTASHLTHKQMAWRIGLSVPSIKAKEKGYRAIASNELDIWAKACGCSVDWLVLGEGKAPAGLDKIDHIQADGVLHRKHRMSELERVMRC